MPGVRAVILFIHGFGSCGWGNKSLALRRRFGVRHLIAPDLCFTPEAAIVQLGSLIRRYRVGAMIGSSLGGYYATRLNAEYALPSVLLNPVVRPHALLAAHRGAQRRWCDDARFEVDDAYVKQLAGMQRAHLAPAERYLVMIEQGDELLDHREAADFYAGQDVVEIPGGDHRFSDIERHLEAIALWLAEHAPGAARD